jgi:hypothetical protein
MYPPAGPDFEANVYMEPPWKWHALSCKL